VVSRLARTRVPFLEKLKTCVLLYFKVLPADTLARYLQTKQIFELTPALQNNVWRENVEMNRSETSSPFVLIEAVRQTLDANYAIRSRYRQQEWMREN